MLQKTCYNSLFCFVHSHPLGVQKEPQSAMVKATKPNQRKGFSQWQLHAKIVYFSIQISRYLTLVEIYPQIPA